MPCEKHYTSFVLNMASHMLFQDKHNENSHKGKKVRKAKSMSTSQLLDELTTE
jgi:hypothetical protein